MSMFIFNSSLFFQIIASAIPLSILAYKRTTFNPYLTLILFISFIIIILQTITHFFEINNHILFNFYVLCCFLLYFLFFTKNLKNNLILVASIPFPIFIGFVLYEIFHNQLLIISFRITNISLIYWSFLCFISLLKDDSAISNKTTLQIVNTSIFVYNSGSFILYLSIFSLMLDKYWFIHNFFEGGSKLLIAYAFWKLPKSDNFGK